MVEVGEPTAVVGQFLKAELTNAKRKNGESFRQSVCVGVRACVCVCVWQASSILHMELCEARANILSARRLGSSVKQTATARYVEPSASWRFTQLS